MALCGEGSGTLLQYSCLENPMGRGAWWAVVHGVAKSQTRLSDFSFTFHFYALEKAMATRSSVLAWRIPGTGEPGGLPSVGSHRVGHDWSDLAAAGAVDIKIAVEATEMFHLPQPIKTADSPKQIVRSENHVYREPPGSSLFLISVCGFLFLNHWR